MIRETCVAGGDSYLAVARERINGGGPTVVLVHATSFCRDVWRPVLDELASSGTGLDAITFDLPGHGRSGSLRPPLSWWRLGGDVLRVLADRRRVIGVGHSAGGAALALAELLQPATFRSLILVEPVIPPPPFKRIEEHPLAVGALRRSVVFPDRRAAEANFRDRGPFVGWDERAFQGYLSGGFKANPDGPPGALLLACSPDQEAEYYRSGSDHRGWDRLGELAVPTEIVAGEDSETHRPRLLGNLTGRMQRATVTIVPGANHFVSMQRPDVIAGAIAGAVSQD